LSATTQNDRLAQEIEFGDPPYGSIPSGADHVPAASTTTRPFASPTTQNPLAGQNLADAHATWSFSPDGAVGATGADHAWPSHSSALP